MIQHKLHLPAGGLDEFARSMADRCDIRYGRTAPRIDPRLPRVEFAVPYDGAMIAAETYARPPPSASRSRQLGLQPLMDLDLVLPYKIDLIIEVEAALNPVNSELA